MINPYYFTDRNLNVGFKINLDSHHINHADSNLTNIPYLPEFEIRFVNKIIKELSAIYARIINQCKFKYQTVFSAKFDKQDEDNQILDETEIFINLNSNHNLTESDLHEIDNKSPLEHQKQQKEMKDSGWRFDKINSMTVYFYKTGELNGSNYNKIPLRSFEIFSKDWWAIPLKSKYSKTKTDAFSIFLTTSKRSPLKIDSDRGSEWYFSVFQNLLKNNNRKHFS